MTERYILINKINNEKLYPPHVALLFSASQFVNAQCGISGQSNFITSQEALNALEGCEVFQGVKHYWC